MPRDVRALLKELPGPLRYRCVAASIGVRRQPDGLPGVWIDCGREATGLDPVPWAREAVRRRRDLPHVDRPRGHGKGYELVDGITIGGSDAVSAANVLHFTEQSTKTAKEVMRTAGVAVR